MMPIILESSRRLRTKYRVMLAVLGGLSVGGTLLVAWGVASAVGAEAPLTTALLVALIGNGLWIVPLGLLIRPFCQSLRYELHQDEAVVRVGAITRSVKHVPYRTVTNVELVRGPFDRLFGLGTLKIQTAGMRGQRGAEQMLLGLVDVDAVYGLVAAALRRYHGALAADAAGERDRRLMPGTDLARADSASLGEPLPELAPLPPQEITVSMDYGEMRPLLEAILRELRVIRQNIQL